MAAAGSGKRMGGGIAKQYRQLAGKEVLNHSLSAFAYHPFVDDIFLVVKQMDVKDCWERVSTWGISKVKKVLPGGKERQDSVSLALRSLMEEAIPPDLILIHDGARPFVDDDLITRIIQATLDNGAAVPGIGVRDTIKSVEDNFISETMERSKCYSIQTPQGFKAQLLVQAYERSERDGFYGTDDASLVERMGHKVFIVEGSEKNIKITTELDMRMGEIIMDNREEESDASMRIGIGFDVHAFEADRKLILGGVAIPFGKGLSGHSDADVLTHALMDALLGACGFPDIGELFPDTEKSYKDISSIILLQRAVEMVSKKGWKIVNADIILIAEEPKIRPYKEEMIGRLSKALTISGNRINIKGTTTEKLGFCGRGEGIAAQAVVLCQNFGGTL